MTSSHLPTSLTTFRNWNTPLFCPTSRSLGGGKHTATCSSHDHSITHPGRRAWLWTTLHIARIRDHGGRSHRRPWCRHDIGTPEQLWGPRILETQQPCLDICHRNSKPANWSSTLDLSITTTFTSSSGEMDFREPQRVQSDAGKRGTAGGWLGMRNAASLLRQVACARKPGLEMKLVRCCYLRLKGHPLRTRVRRAGPCCHRPRFTRAASACSCFHSPPTNHTAVDELSLSSKRSWKALLLDFHTSPATIPTLILILFVKL